jgi:hypothetical protein
MNIEQWGGDFRMESRNKTLFISLMAWIFLTGLLVLADGGPSHKATAEESALSDKVLNAFVKALPAGPIGWEKTGGTVIEPLKIVYAEANTPLHLEYSVSWQDARRNQEAQMKMAEAASKLDPKKVTEKQMEELQKMLDLHDVDARINMNTNVFFQWIDPKAEPIPGVGGGLAYRSPSDFYNNSWREGFTYVFLGGTWEKDPNGPQINFMAEKKKSSAVVQNIVVIVQADAKRADSLLRGINWDTLKALVTK